jgi:hypothetical protein
MAQVVFGLGLCLCVVPGGCRGRRRSHRRRIGSTFTRAGQCEYMVVSYRASKGERAARCGCTETCMDERALPMFGLPIIAGGDGKGGC